MRIYEAADGQWILWDGEVKTFYPDEAQAQAALDTLIQENSMASRKETFAKTVVDTLTQLAQVVDAAENERDVYTDREYDITDPIVESDLAAEGITLAQFNTGLVLIREMLKFVDNQAPAVADYAATLNIIRNDL